MEMAEWFMTTSLKKLVQQNKLDERLVKTPTAAVKTSVAAVNQNKVIRKQNHDFYHALIAGDQ